MPMDGCPSVFITITVHDAHNCLSLHMCFPIANHANSQFPCPETDASDFLCALVQGDEVFRDNIPIRNGDLMKMINENSVAAVLFLNFSLSLCMNICLAFFRIAYGVKLRIIGSSRLNVSKQ